MGQHRDSLPAGDAGSGARPRRERPLTLPAPSFAHLAALTDSVGLFEHAEYLVPRPEHGYCTDDVARALAVVAREPDPSPEVHALAEIYISFLEQAQRPDGRFHNRRSVGIDGEFTDRIGSDDSNGRALHGLGIAALSGTGELAARALACFEAGAAVFTSTSPRANAFAVRGAAAVATRHPRHAGAALLFMRAERKLVRLTDSALWPWPEHRLAYDNARLAEALLAAGTAFHRPSLVDEGLAMLRWLLEVELDGDAFSFTPVGGWGPGDPRPGFDQQPVEAGAMADTCALAYTLTGEQQFAESGLLAAGWFYGLNDTGVVMADEASGGCHDGLMPKGANENEGAESTLSLLCALQAAWAIQALRNTRSSSSVDTYAAPTHRSAAPYVI